LNRLSTAHERCRQTTERRAIAYSEREFTFAKNGSFSEFCLATCVVGARIQQYNDWLLMRVLLQLVYSNKQLRPVSTSKHPALSVLDVSNAAVHPSVYLTSYCQLHDTDMPVKDRRNTALVNTARRSYPSQCSEGNRASSVKARYTLPVSTGPVHGPYPQAREYGVQNDARVHGPWTRP